MTQNHSQEHVAQGAQVGTQLSWGKGTSLVCISPKRWLYICLCTAENWTVQGCYINPSPWRRIRKQFPCSFLRLPSWDLGSVSLPESQRPWLPKASSLLFLPNRREMGSSGPVFLKLHCAGELPGEPVSRQPLSQRLGGMWSRIPSQLPGDAEAAALAPHDEYQKAGECASHLVRPLIYIGHFNVLAMPSAHALPSTWPMKKPTIEMRKSDQVLQLENGSVWKFGLVSLTPKLMFFP